MTKTKKIVIKKNNTKKNNFINYSFEKNFEKENKLYLTKSNRENNREIAKDIYDFYHYSKYNPKNDFYNWVNYDWLKSFDIKKHPQYIVQFDNFRLVQHKVYLELFDIIRDYLKVPRKDPFYKCLLLFYNSTKKTSSLKELKTDLLNTIDIIDKIRENKNNAWKMLGYFNRSELYSTGCPFVFDVAPDAKDPTKFCVNLSSMQFSLIDPNIYFNDGKDITYKANYKKKFLKYIKDLFELTLGKDNGLNEEDVFNVEAMFINTFACKTEIDDKNGYNKLTAKEALEKYKFDFNEFCKELGFKTIPKWFIINNLNYLSCATKIYLENWDSNMFRTYWIYNYIRRNALYCLESRKILFDFNGKFVRGEGESFERYDINGIFALGLAFNTFLTNQYVKKFSNANDIHYLQDLANDLKSVFIRIIKRNKWLVPKTKRYALLKLNHLKLIIGSPEILREDPILNYTDNFLQNVKLICDWRFKQLVKLDGQSTKDVDIPTVDWTQYPPKFSSTQAYVVNAYYTPIQNSIYVPLAYIQAPFIDLKQRGLAYNLAHVGITLGHEMSHSLDNWGSQYDYKGRLFNWWTKEDANKFKKIQNDVIKQYEEFAKRDGIIYDVEQGLGEDMADISGLAICTEYLRDFLEYNKVIIPVQDNTYRSFFIHYGYQYREKISKKALDSQLKTNPHPLDKYRTNIPLSRILLFRKIYDIKKKNQMWWHNLNTIWNN